MTPLTIAYIRCVPPAPRHASTTRTVAKPHSTPTTPRSYFTTYQGGWDRPPGDGQPPAGAPAAHGYILILPKEPKVPRVKER